MDANTFVMRRAIILWVGTGLLISFNIFAASQRSPSLIYWALALTGAFALFGIWAARKVTARPS